ncbi:MAG: endonuclease/exonuclease/phosphatase family protein [Myxococcota bacterium]
MARKRKTAPRLRRLRDVEVARRALFAAAVPYLGMVRAPRSPLRDRPLEAVFSVATYNVHRWSGLTGGNRFEPDRASRVIAELDADLIALQEVLRPFSAPDPLETLAEELGLHAAFVVTRVHKRGELGNAILSRRPITGVFSLDLSVGRLERRSAIVTELHDPWQPFSLVATHLALVDRSRHQQVRSLLEHPRLQGPVILLGDLNAWRNCKATQALDRALPAEHHNLAWPASFPASRPLLALDRVYARGARVVEVRTHASSCARRASDHLPVIARIARPPRPETAAALPRDSECSGTIVAK